MPRDVEARERLRQAQDAEARSVSAVYAAQNALAAATAKRDRAVAAAEAVLAEAQRAVAVAQANLAAVSGIDRASTLLGVTSAALRRARAMIAERGASSDS
jgi:hypothetical protein